MGRSFDSRLGRGLKGMTVKYPSRVYLSELVAETSLEKKWHMGRVHKELLFYSGLLKFQGVGAQVYKVIDSHRNSAWRRKTGREEPPDRSFYLIWPPPSPFHTMLKLTLFPCCSLFILLTVLVCKMLCLALSSFMMIYCVVLIFHLNSLIRAF